MNFNKKSDQYFLNYFYLYMWLKVMFKKNKEDLMLKNFPMNDFNNSFFYYQLFK
jgi:hypothetical protein